MTKELNENSSLNTKKEAQRPRCKDCGNEITYIVKYCPRCGEELY